MNQFGAQGEDWMKEHAMAPQDSSEANNRGSINWDDDEVEQAPSEGGEER